MTRRTPPPHNEKPEATLIKPRGLGKGLSALLPNNNNSSGDSSKYYLIDIEVQKIHPNPNQPRQAFKEEDLISLSKSILEKGVLQPIIIRKLSYTSYEIVAGERRWRASKLASLTTIPAIIVNLTDKETLEVGLIENLQRQNLNPLEEATTFNRLIKDFHYTHAELSKVVGVNRSYISNYIRILELPSEVKDFIKKNLLSMGHAKILVGNNNALEIANEIIKKSLSVRQLESLLRGGFINQKQVSINIDTVNSDLDASTTELTTHLNQIFQDCNTKVKVLNDGSGYIKIKFKKVDDIYKYFQ